MKKLAILFICGIVAFALLQLVRPAIPTKPATATLAAPPEVQHILEKDCYSCHSDQPRLAWFDEVVPSYWLVRHDILKARRHLDFSTLGEKPPAVQRATLFEAVAMIQLGAMPLPSFTKLHPEANVTPEELATLKTYLAPWSTLPPTPASAPAPPAQPVSLNSIQPELNGLTFDPTFETWKPISTTDRGDNNTFRFILGNDIAITAIRSGNIKPWPNGARFAKIAWQQQLGPDGLIHPGNFIQVELMVKDAHAYKKSEGWGWGRWRTLNLKPYGKNAAFVGECTTCHLPVRGNDYVYTLPITTAHVDGNEIVNNTAAALPSNLPYQPLGWNAITLYVDPKNHTTATLYGNDIAFRSIQSHPTPSSPTYQPGSVLALVTWSQRDDPHWFGARIPQQLQSIEFVNLRSADAITYASFDSAGHVQTTANSLQRTTSILTLTPAPLP